MTLEVQVLLAPRFANLDHAPLRAGVSMHGLLRVLLPTTACATRGRRLPPARCIRLAPMATPAACTSGRGQRVMAG